MQNAIKITEGESVTYLISRHRHDYKSYTFKNGTTISIDGGPDSGYVRYCGDRGIWDNPEIVKYYGLNKDSPFKLCLELLLWGSLGKSGKDKIKFLPFKELGLSHLKAILEYDNKLKQNLSALQKKVINYWIDQKAIDFS